MQHFYPVPTPATISAPISKLPSYSPNIQQANVAAEVTIESYFIQTQFRP